MVTITSGASDESNKTFTVTGTDMSGNALIEVITGPEASKTVTGRRIFKMAPIHHHFEQKGWSESTIVIRFWIIAIILALIGLASLKLR